MRHAAVAVLVAAMAACGSEARPERAARPPLALLPLPPMPTATPDPTPAEAITTLAAAHLAPEALDTLVAALGRADPKEVLAPAWILARLGADALPLLFAMLATERADLADLAASAIYDLLHDVAISLEDRARLAAALRPWLGRVGGVASTLRELGSAGAEVLARAPGDTREVSRALSQLGVDAVPALRGALRDGIEVGRALKHLGWLGAKAAPALPELVALLENPEWTRQATGVLAAIGETAASAAPALRTLLGDPRHGAEAARALVAAGDRSRETATALAAALSRNPRRYLESLALLGAPAADARPAVEPYLESEDARVRAGAAAAWLRLGGDRERARRIVAELVAEGWADAADREIARALEVLGADAAPLVAPLVAGAESLITWTSHSPDPPLVTALRDLGAIAAPGILAALDSDDSETRFRAAVVLDRIELPIPAAVPRLLRLAGEGDHCAARALGVSGRDTEGIVHQLMGLLDNEGSGLAAAYALGDLGPRARAAVPRLLQRARGDRGVFLAPVFGQIGLATPEALDFLVHALEHHSEQAALALARLGDAAAPAVPELRRIAAGGGDVGAAAARAIERITGDPGPLLAMLASGDARSRPRMLYDMEKFGCTPAEAAALLPCLIMAPDLRTRRRAAELAARLGPAAAAAAPLLQEIADDPRETEGLRARAREALRAIAAR